MMADGSESWALQTERMGSSMQAANEKVIDTLDLSVFTGVNKRHVYVILNLSSNQGLKGPALSPRSALQGAIGTVVGLQTSRKNRTS